MAVYFGGEEVGRGSPSWLALGQGNSHTVLRALAFLETCPSDEGRVRVKLASFRSCSPGLTFKYLKNEKRGRGEL